MKHIWNFIKKICRFITGVIGALIAIILLLILIPLNAIRCVSPKETIQSVRFAWEMGKDEEES